MPHNHAVFRAFGTSFRPISERKADGEEESRLTRARRTDASSEKIFHNPPSLPLLSYPKPTFVPSPSRLLLAPFFFLRLTFLFRSISSLLSQLLSISIAIGRTILVSSFTAGFRTRLSRHLRASHAASSDHLFSETAFPSKRALTSHRAIARQPLCRFIRHFRALHFYIYCMLSGYFFHVQR